MADTTTIAGLANSISTLAATDLFVLDQDQGGGTYRTDNMTADKLIWSPSSATQNRLSKFGANPYQLEESGISVDANNVTSIGTGSQNYWQVQPTATGVTPILSVLGVDSNIGIDFYTKNSGAPLKVLGFTNTGVATFEASIAAENVIEAYKSDNTTQIRFDIDAVSPGTTLAWGTGGSANQFGELGYVGGDNIFDTKATNFIFKSTSNNNILAIDSGNGRCTFGYDVYVSNTIFTTQTSGTVLSVAVTAGNTHVIGAGQGNGYNFDGSSGQFITSTSNAYVFIDSNNDDTTRTFEIRKDADGPNAPGGGTLLFSINESGLATFTGDATGINNLTVSGNINNGSFVSSSGNYRFNSSDSGTTNYLDINSNTNGYCYIDSSDGFLNIRDNLGINVNQAARKLEILDSSSAQFRLSQNAATHFTDFQVDTTGRLNLVSSSGSFRVTSSDSGTTNFLDIVAENNGYIDISSSDGLLYFNDKIQYLTGASQTLTANGQTVAYDGAWKFVNSDNGSGPYTGTILTAGTRTGEEITITNNTGTASHLAWAADATSNIQDAAGAEIEPGMSRTFRWDAGTSRWWSIGYNVIV